MNKIHLFKGPNLEIRLIRKMNRWDLRNPEVYSCASVFDITMLAKPFVAQNVQFQLRNEFQGMVFYQPQLFEIISILLEVENIVMQLKWIQHPNPRMKSLADVCQYPSDHPVAFEPEHLCDQGKKRNRTCIPCLGLKKARSFVNKCYAAQHSECNDDESTGTCYWII